jgi:hypothetical protein
MTLRTGRLILELPLEVTRHFRKWSPGFALLIQEVRVLGALRGLE